MRTMLASVVLVAFLSVSHTAAAADSAAAQKPIKTLINAIRYGKFDTAAKQLTVGEMVKRLLGAEAGKFNPAEQQELVKGLETLIRAKSFTQGKEMFEYLDNVIYGDVRNEGTDTLVKSTIVVNRNLKKTEIVIDWTLVPEGGSLKIVDITMMGDSTVAAIREDQVQPLLAEGGPAAVMKALREQVAKATKK